MRERRDVRPRQPHARAVEVVEPRLHRAEVRGRRQESAARSGGGGRAAGRGTGVVVHSRARGPSRGSSARGAAARSRAPPPRSRPERSGSSRGSRSRSCSRRPAAPRRRGSGGRATRARAPTRRAASPGAAGRCLEQARIVRVHASRQLLPHPVERLEEIRARDADGRELPAKTRRHRQERGASRSRPTTTARTSRLAPAFARPVPTTPTASISAEGGERRGVVDVQPLREREEERDGAPDGERPVEARTAVPRRARTAQRRTTSGARKNAAESCSQRERGSVGEQRPRLEDALQPARRIGDVAARSRRLAASGRRRSRRRSRGRARDSPAKGSRTAAAAARTARRGQRGPGGEIAARRGEGVEEDAFPPRARARKSGWKNPNET